MKRHIILILLSASGATGFLSRARLTRHCQVGTAIARSDCSRKAVLDDATSDDESSRVTCWNPRLRRVLGTIAAAGSLETAYLTFSKLTGTTEQLCGTGGDCSSVLNGPYASIPGTEIPIAALGFLAYTTVAALAVGPIVQKQTDDEDNRILLTTLTTAMGIFSVFLMTLLFGVLKESCTYCIVSAVFSILLAKLCWLGGSIPKNRTKDGIVASAGGGLVSFLTAVVLFVSYEAPVPAVNVAGDLVGSSSPQSTLLASMSSKGQAPPPISATSSERAMALARDLEQLDTRFFGAFWCGHCLDQKQALGKEAMARIPYIECSRDGLNSQTALCMERDVPGYPTWEINGKLYPGEKDLGELEYIVKRAQN